MARIRNIKRDRFCGLEARALAHSCGPRVVRAGQGAVCVLTASNKSVKSVASPDVTLAQQPRANEVCLKLRSASRWGVCESARDRGAASRIHRAARILRMRDLECLEVTVQRAKKRGNGRELLTQAVGESKFQGAPRTERQWALCRVALHGRRALLRAPLSRRR